MIFEKHIEDNHRGIRGHGLRIIISPVGSFEGIIISRNIISFILNYYHYYHNCCFCCDFSSFSSLIIMNIAMPLCVLHPGF